MDNKIIYPDKVYWRKALTDNALDNYGKSNKARIKSTLTKIENVSIKIVPVTNEILEWFVPMYEETIGEKDNPSMYNVRETIENSPREVLALILEENGQKIGATIFTMREKMLAISYRIYPNTWTTQKLQANPSLYTDYIISEYAINEGKTTLSHGVDRNWYGKNSSIGLAAFKLSVGCKAGTPKRESEILEIDINDIKEESLIISFKEKGAFSDKAFLFCDKENPDKWDQVCKYPELIEVEKREI